VTEDLRALLRADLSEERPPPLGDLVDAAIRDGRRIRRRRRISTITASLLALAAAVTAFVLVGDGGVAGGRQDLLGAAGDGSPQTVPPVPPVPKITGEARTLTIRSGMADAGGSQRKATSAAMLHLLTELLPPGRTSHFGVAPGDDLQVRLYLDEGAGPGLVKVAVGKEAPNGAEPPRGATASVTIRHMPDNCLQSLAVDAAWPDGTLVQVDVATCLDRAGDSPTRSDDRAETTPLVLTVDEAVRVAADPRWGVTMDAALVSQGAREFPAPPVFG